MYYINILNYHILLIHGLVTLEASLGLQNIFQNKLELIYTFNFQ